MLKLDFTGKNVLVVGGGRGIGKACALNYADCGANIFIGNRNEEQGKSTVEEIKKMGARADFCRALMYMLLAVPTQLMISKQVICSSFISSMCRT